MSTRNFNPALAAGIAAARSGRPRRARLWLRRAIDVQPTCLDAWKWLAAVARTPAESRACWQQVSALCPDDEEARLELARPPRLHELLQSVRDALRAGRNAEARQLTSTAVACYPHSETAWMWLAALLPGGAGRQEAVRRALQLNPANDLAQAAWARLTFRPPATPRSLRAASARLAVTSQPAVFESAPSRPDTKPLAFRPPIRHCDGAAAIAEPVWQARTIEAWTSRPDALPNAVRHALALDLFRTAATYARPALAAAVTALVVLIAGAFAAPQIALAPGGSIAPLAAQAADRPLPAAITAPSPIADAVIHSDVKSTELRLADKMVAPDPDELALLAAAHLRTGQLLAAGAAFDRSVEYYDLALDADPDLALARAERGYAYAQIAAPSGSTDDRERSLVDLALALNIEPRLTNAVVGRGFDVQFQCDGIDSPLSVMLASAPYRQRGCVATVAPAHDVEPDGLAAEWMPVISQWAEPIERQARYYGIAPDLIAGVVRAESWGDPQAESRLGAIGLMQVMPRERGIDWRPLAEELRDPNTNISWGVALLRDILQQANGDIGVALEAYSGGWEMVGSGVGAVYTQEVLGYCAEHGAAEQGVGLDSDYGLVQVIWDDAGRERLNTVRHGPLTSTAYTTLADMVLGEPAASHGLWIPLYDISDDDGTGFRSSMLVVPSIATQPQTADRTASH